MTHQDKNLDKPLEIIVLAAGQGTRMRSHLPKVLHPMAGRTMLGHVLDTARSLEPRRIHVVVGHGADQVRAAAGQDGAGINWVVQHEQKGTAHAVAQALPEVGEQSTVLVTFGDAPLVCATTLRECAAAAEQDALALVTEWKPFRHPDFRAMKDIMKQPVVFDGRNQYDPRSVKEEGFEYFGIGRR